MVTIPRFHVRRLAKRDVSEVVELEYTTFPAPVSRAGIRRWVQGEGTAALIAEPFEYGEGVAGYAFFRKLCGKIDIDRINVAPEWRRQGVGSSLIAHIKWMLNADCRVLEHVVHEVDGTDARLFLQANGFRVMKVRREYFKKDKRDGYEMCYQADS
jgi:[ribosomal protein S18]-alanine N-acetyltransferase